jgi:hypothetical protein
MVKEGKSYYTIGLYYPAGNVQGLVKENVHKLIGDDDEKEDDDEKSTTTASTDKEDEAEKDD